MPSTGELTPEGFSELAHSIWRECYTDFLGKPKVEYMLAKFQSPEAIADQIADGHVYRAILWGGEVCGYSSHVYRDDGCFISKIYVSSSHRGRGLGRWRLDAIMAEAKAAGAERAYLTVNKDNAGSIAFYESIGMEICDATVVDIGGGFNMDDYVLERRFVARDNKRPHD